MLTRLSPLLVPILCGLMLFQWSRAVELKHTLRKTTESLDFCSTELGNALIEIDTQNLAVSSFADKAKSDEQVKLVESKGKEVELSIVLKKDISNPADADSLNRWLNDVFRI